MPSLALSVFAKAFARVARRRLREGPLRPGWSLPMEVAMAAMRELLTLSYREPIVGRQQQDAFARALPSRALRKVRHQGQAIGGVPGDWVRPPGAVEGPDRPLLLYFHGGGYVMGSFATHGDLLAMLALRSGVPSFAPAYRLAPEHPYPAAVDDAVAVYEGLLQAGVPPARIVVGGDSAGGGLSLALLMRLRDGGRPLPAGALLVSPWVDLTCSQPSVESNSRYDYGDRQMLLHWADLYRGAVDARDGMISPLYADLAGLPPLLCFAGACELLADEVTALVEKARAAGTPAELILGPDMTHDYLLFHLMAPAAVEGLDRAARFLTEHTGA